MGWEPGAEVRQVSLDTHPRRAAPTTRALNEMRRQGGAVVNFTELRVRSKIHPDTLAAMKGKVLGEGDHDVRLVGPTNVYRADGRILARYLPAVLRDDLPEAYETLHELRKQETHNRGLASGTERLGSVAGSRWNYAAPVASALIGAMDPKTPRNYCRLTAFSGQEAEAFSGLFPLFRAIDRAFAQYEPERYAAQRRFIENTHPDWRIGDTNFTTVTVNNSYPTGVHTDKGDLDEGFSTLAVLRKGDYRGGTFTFPEYRIAIDLQDGDLLLMDAHEWHGNTAMFCNVCNDRIGPGGRDDHDVTCGVERISVVSYYRTRMKECGTFEEESAKAKAWAETQADYGVRSNPMIGPASVEELAAEAAG